ncbi:MAG: sigma-70 family RNA polymerase sigma factor [Pyrinomonadaceae bacterium]|nr:sigma-70 family RNA polymerase sigma factor [Pyrinomonadaceae bacterium]
MPPAQLHVDQVLLPWLRISDEAESQRILVQIVNEHADPVIKDIIRYKLRTHTRAPDNGRDGDEAEDIYNDAVVQLLARLREFKSDPQQRAIGNLRSYVAVVAYNCCYRHLRQVYPQRHILKSKLRYLLTRQKGFALWEGTDKELACGFEAWRDERKAANRERVKQLDADPNIIIESGLLIASAQQAKPAEVLAAVFAYAGGAVKLDELVNICARLWGIRDQTAALEADEASMNRLSHEQSDFTAELDRQEYLKKLWAEIVALPVSQRAALLLNLRDGEGRGCIDMFQLAGIASIRRIAEALEVSLEQFAALWNELPLDDLKIAERLSLTRQQVINLRKSARARLARRMKIFG